MLRFTYIILIFLCLKSVHVFTSWKQKYTRLLKSSIDISCISHFYRFTVIDTSFHASWNDFICEDRGKCLKSRSGLRRHRLRQHLKQEMKFKCTIDSCTAAFCEKGSYWLIRPATVNKNVSHLITVTTNWQGISQSSWGRDSSTCSERIISSGLLDQMTIIVIVCKLIIKI